MKREDKNEIWQNLLNSLKVSVTSAVYSTWLSKTHLISLRKITEERYIAEIGCLSAFVKATLETRYFGLIQDNLMSLLKSPCDLIFSVKDTPNEKFESTKSETPPLFSEKKNDEMFIQKLTVSKIRPHQQFDNFAVSSSNQMAWAAAEAVSQNPGVSYNPLFIWGGVGVGKTHLMNAVGYRILENDLSAKILLTSAEELTNDIVSGIRTKSMQNVRDKYRKLKLLLVDDIQFIAGKEKAQEEFFHTFNAVTTAGGQVILTSDRPPHEISKLEERLRSRFEAGLIVDISAPDFELRCAIIQIKAQEKNINIGMDLIQLIASNIDSTRKIEGFMIQLATYSKFQKTPVTEELVTKLLGKGVDTLNDKQNRRKIYSPEELIQAVSLHYSINKRALMGKARSRIIARPRQVLMYLLRTELMLPLEEVGNLVGGRDHTTVMHAVETITKLTTIDPRVREDILGIKNSYSG